ncbi:MAG: cupin domain-containing protein [Chitinophagaceae bacterium]
MKKKLVTRRDFINPIYKDRLRVLKTSEETGGVYTLAEIDIAPGGSNTMHIHSAFEETFTAIKGTLGVRIKNKKHFLHPGGSMTVPLYTPHYFFNEGKESITCQIQFFPAHENFIKGLAIAYGLAADGMTSKKGIPKSILQLALIMQLTDTKPAGLSGVLFPVFKWLARKARKNGMEKVLLEKYYYQ